jgi:arylsulfatase
MRRRPLTRRAGLVLAICGLVALSVWLALGRSGRWSREGAETRAPSAALRPNLVLVTVDTLRADHLGSWGYPRATSPHIDRLAASGVRYKRAISQAPWTLPSMASLHTALYPREHGAVSARHRLGPEKETVAEVLRRAGYRTLGIVSHLFVSRRYGLDQGFEEFDESFLAGPESVTSPLLTRRALELLEENRREPFFLWIHYFDPHFSYVRHPEFRFAGPSHPSQLEWISYGELSKGAEALAERGEPLPFSVERVRAIYDEEIAFTDAAIGELLDGFERLELDRPTITILTADHGEYFMERGSFGHGRDVYQELVHVPLIVAGAIDEALRGLVVGRNVEIASIAPTLAELAGVEGSPFQGEDLLAVARSPLPGTRSFSEGSHAWGTDDRKVMVMSEGWKLIHRLDDEGYELYDLREDPTESDDLWGSEAPGVERRREVLLEALEGYRRRALGTAVGIELGEEERERLRALGYIQ